MSDGPSPWLQRHWDARAALNFIFGGTGAGLLVLAAAAALTPLARQATTLLGLALIAAGLFSVWLETGRRLRAAHVMFNPFTSWMTRESFVALLVFGCGIASLLLAQRELGAATAVAALAFVYCQGRILQASKGIPAWREPMLTWLIVTTALAEGAGLMLAVAPLAGASAEGVIAFGALALVARGWTWSMYWRRVDKRLVAQARRRLERAGKLLLQLGTIAPLALLLGAAVWPQTAALAAALGGIAALAAGWAFKFVLVTRAAFNQGFALPRLPVRGSR